MARPSGAHPIATQHLHANAEALPGAAFCCDEAFHITFVNSAACKTLGADALELVGKHLSQLVEMPAAGAPVDELFRTDPVAPRRVTRPDGSTFWGLLSSTRIGEWLVIQVFDVSSLKQANEDLVYRESMWRFAIEAAAHGVWDYNVITDARFYSVGWKRMRGFADDAIISASAADWESRLHPDDLERVRRHVADTNANQAKSFAYAYRERRADGAWVWISSRGQAVEWAEDGTPTRLTGTDTDITELMHSTQAVDALKRRLELALTASGVGVWEIDLETQTFSCDAVLAEMYDFPNRAGDTIPLAVWMNALHPDDVEVAAGKARQAMMSGTSLENSFRIVRRNGEVRRIETSCVFYVGPNGKPQFLGADRDVTDAWEREQELSAQNMRFEAALQNMGRGLAMFDADGKLIVANASFADIYGFPDHLMARGTSAKAVADYLRDSGKLEAEIVKTAIDDALSIGRKSQSFDRTWRLSSGRIVSYSTTPLETGGWVSVHRDITEQHLAARQLTESEERFRDFTITASDWCWESDADLRITYLTDSFEANTGIAPSKIIGLILFDAPVLGEDLPKMKALFETSADGRPTAFKDVLLRMPSAAGRITQFLVSGLPKFDENGALLGYRGTGTDVTAAEMRKTQLAEAEALLTTRSEQLIEAQKIGKIGDWSFYPGDDHVWWAPETFVLLGHDPQTFETSLEAVIAIYVGDGAKRVMASQSEVARTGTIKSVDVKARRCDGSIGDFVVTSKGRFDESGAITALYGTIQDISERKQAEEQLERLAFFDPLTGLANRTLFQREVDKMLVRSRGKDLRGGLLLLDLDRFKEVNDSLGHAAGDELLNKVSQLLSGAIERKHFLARLGGDEFAIVVPNAGAHELKMLARRLNRKLSGLLRLERGEVNVSTSIGVACFPEDGNNLADLLRHADLALYQAKEKGRDRFEFFKPDLSETVQNKIELSRDLRQAVTNNVGLHVHYQPQIDLGTGRVTGFEALMRWNHPERGAISPAEFIPIAESSHLICDIGIWILRAAATQAVAWLASGQPPREIAVNVSAAQIWHSDLVADVKTVLNETGLQPSLLCLELTESLLADHAEGRVRKVLKDLSALGVTLALDDFGTGYSSLGYLRQLPFHKLKIDRLFVDGADNSVHAKELLKGIVALGRGLNMATVAEGAERAAEVELLKEVGCDFVQGYVFARPSSAAEALAYAVECEGVLSEQVAPREPRVRLAR